MVRDYFSQKVTLKKELKKSLLGKDGGKCKGPEAMKELGAAEELAGLLPARGQKVW